MVGSEKKFPAIEVMTKVLNGFNDCVQFFLHDINLIFTKTEQYIITMKTVTPLHILF